jgi:hypothetical protein
MTLKLTLLLVWCRPRLTRRRRRRRRPPRSRPWRAPPASTRRIVVDTHIDTTMMLGARGGLAVRHEPKKGEDSNHVDLPRIKEGARRRVLLDLPCPALSPGPRRSSAR